MRYQDDKNMFIPRVTRPTENGSPEREQLEQSSVNSPSRICPSISTERIMQAVEQHRRISQQLDDLRIQQKQRTLFLRTTGLKLCATACGVFAVLGTAFLVLLLLRPTLLARTLGVLSDGIAALLMVEESLRLGLSLIPSSSWLLSGVALVVVLMMGMWIRLMRHPHEA